MIQELRSHWNLLFQFAVWGFNIVAQFIAPPPTTALNCPPGVSNCRSSTEYLAKYGLAIIIGLAMIATRLYGKRRHLPIWIALTVVALVGAYISYSNYLSLQNKWICVLDTTRQPPLLSLKGEDEHLTEEAKESLSISGCTDGCKGILSCFDNDPKQVWLSDEIDRRRFYLTATYFSTLPLFILGIIFISQAIYCATREDSRKQFAGHWRSVEVNENVRHIELIIIIANKRIEGRLLNVNKLDPPDIVEASIRRDTLTFVHGRNRVRYEMNLVKINEASLSQKEIERPKHWHLSRLTQEQL